MILKQSSSNRKDEMLKKDLQHREYSRPQNYILKSDNNKFYIAYIMPNKF